MFSLINLVFEYCKCNEIVSFNKAFYELPTESVQYPIAWIFYMSGSLFSKFIIKTRKWDPVTPFLASGIELTMTSSYVAVVSHKLKL